MALEYSHKAAVKEKRGVGPVTVLQAADLDSCSSLGEKVDKMCENRYDIFLHNVEYLRKKYKLSQAQLCSKKLCNCRQLSVRSKWLPSKTLVRIYR